MPRGFVANFIGGLTAWAAVLSTNVLNVMLITMCCRIIFVLKSLPQNEPPLLPNHALLTPVQIKKLRPLLCG